MNITYVLTLIFFTESKNIKKLVRCDLYIYIYIYIPLLKVAKQYDTANVFLGAIFIPLQSVTHLCEENTNTFYHFRVTFLIHS